MKDMKYHNNLPDSYMQSKSKKAAQPTETIAAESEGIVRI